MEIKKLHRGLFISGLMLSTWLQAAGAPIASTSVTLDTPEKKLSYAIGVEVVRPVLKENIQIDKETFILGAKEAIMGEQLKLSDQQIKDEIAAFVQKIMEGQEKKFQELAQKNKKEGDDFIAKNKIDKTFTTLPSGLQYKTLQSGGKTQHPGPTDIVTAHYKGSLIDGTEFDSSIKRGEPSQFGLNQVIPGWSEVIQLMSPGDKWLVVIPPQLAYGENAPIQTIGPNKTLIFEIELIDFQSQNPEPSTSFEEE